MFSVETRGWVDVSGSGFDIWAYECRIKEVLQNFYRVSMVSPEQEGLECCVAYDKFYMTENNALNALAVMLINDKQLRTQVLYNNLRAKKLL
jgi:hypothetical protein